MGFYKRGDGIVISAVVPFRGKPQMTMECVRSLSEKTVFDHNLEIITVDDGTEEVYDFSFLASRPGQKYVGIRSDVTKGPTWAYQKGLMAATGEFVMICNNDMVFPPSWDGTLLFEYERLFRATTRHGLLCARLHDPQSIGGIDTFDAWIDKSIGYVVEEVRGEANLPFITDTAFLKSFGFDERFVISYQDWDIYERVLRAHSWIESTGRCPVIHLGSQTIDHTDLRVKERIQLDRQAFWSKWDNSVWTMRNYQVPRGL